MSLSGFGGQFLSISHAGTLLFQQEIKGVVGGIVIDLVSAPIPAGNYTLHISAGVGGIEILLPHYVQFVINGNSMIGGKDVHEGPDIWKKIYKKLHHKVNVSEVPPDFALAAPNPEQPVTINLNINTGVGGLDIYRL